MVLEVLINTNNGIDKILPLPWPSSEHELFDRKFEAILDNVHVLLDLIVSCLVTGLLYSINKLLHTGGLTKLSSEDSIDGLVSFVLDLKVILEVPLEQVPVILP
jgi:hypothetical protein